MSAPVLSWLFTARGKVSQRLTVLTPSNSAVRKSTFQPRPSSSLCSAESSEERPFDPTLRANPFPEVTDLFCRLPLPTLFYRPEAANLGDLMRILVRTGVRIKHSLGFSWVSDSAPDISNNKMLYRSINPISRQTDFRVIGR